MKVKWYLSALLVLLTFFGIQQHQVTPPNQEIVLHFANADVSDDETLGAISTIREQLLALGIEVIEVGEFDNGKIRIAYYSETDVESIESSLSQELLVAWKDGSADGAVPSEIPNDEDTDLYDLEISEIHQASGSDWDLEGMIVVELKVSNDRYFYPRTSLLPESLAVHENTNDVASRAIGPNTIFTDHLSYVIPEVRAGPVVS